MPEIEEVEAIIDDGEGGEQIVTVAKSIADRWPDEYRSATQKDGRPTAAAQRITSPAKKRTRRSSAKRAVDVPAGASDTTDTAAATAAADTAAIAATTTEGTTP